jgi:hypothetical protein
LLLPFGVKESSQLPSTAPLAIFASAVKAAHRARTETVVSAEERTVKLSKQFILTIALSLACALLALAGKNRTTVFIEQNLPSLGVKVYFPTAADFGTVTERNVGTASCQVQEKTWGATLHFRMLFVPGNESPMGFFVQYIRVTNPTPSLFDITVNSKKRFVDGKTNAELAARPLLASESLILDVEGSKQTGALYLLASTSEAPENAMQAIFLPGSTNQAAPSPETGCLVQEVAWGKKERYSSTLSSGLWKRSTWAGVVGHQQ